MSRKAVDLLLGVVFLSPVCVHAQPALTGGVGVVGLAEYGAVLGAEYYVFAAGAPLFFDAGVEYVRHSNVDVGNAYFGYGIPLPVVCKIEVGTGTENVFARYSISLPLVKHFPLRISYEDYRDHDEFDAWQISTKFDF